MAQKPRVLLTEPVFDEVADLLIKYTNLTIGERGSYNNTEKLKAEIGAYDALLSMLSNPIDRSVIERADNLKIIANYAVGFNNIDVVAARQKGIKVANTPDVLTETTAEGTFALILATARKFSAAERNLREGAFDGWHPTGFLGSGLHNKTLGIIGMGRIGRALAKRARCFGMSIIYHNRSRLAAETENNLNAVFYSKLEDFLPVCDVLSINCPLTKETHHLLNAHTLSLLKPTAILINASRGPIVEEAALAQALHDNRLGGAGLDVYEFEPQVHPLLLTAPNTVLLPHITSATIKTRKAMGMLAAGAILNTCCGLDYPCNYVA